MLTDLETDESVDRVSEGLMSAEGSLPVQRWLPKLSFYT